MPDITRQSSIFTGMIKDLLPLNCNLQAESTAGPNGCANCGLGHKYDHKYWLSNVDESALWPYDETITDTRAGHHADKRKADESL